MNRQTGSFLAFHKDKRSETLFEYTDFKDVGSQGNPNARIVVLSKHLRTSDGKFVQWRAKGVYEILDTGEILTSDVTDVGRSKVEP
jgi:hypothetical protein